MAEKQYSVYPRRSFLRALEKGWAQLDKFTDRWTTLGPRLAPYNPFYHLGTLAVFLLIVLIVTGIYLTIFYRPGSDRAYASVAAISASWLGLLMRSAHRYASDGLIIVTILHAIKMLFSDRFWGSRWLAWVSGWLMVVLIWTMGLMGYWLVWDRPAQWLTEYFIGVIDGAFAHSILGAELASSTYALFVIVLFLHIFVPPAILVGVFIHGLRLTRTRFWAPPWLMGVSLIALLLITIWRPVTLALPADLSQLVSTATLDWLYMGFLPLLSRIGSPLFWSVTTLLLLAAVALPWLWRGQHDGPAEVIEANCTGCSACARECPYEAIRMVQRDDDTQFESLAVVSPEKCTGCGICVGACPDDAIELERLFSAVVRQDLHRTLARASAAWQAPITVYACDRHAALGTLPPLGPPLSAPQSGGGDFIPLLQAKLPPRINVGTWPDTQGIDHPVITAVIPCTGMLHPNWAAQTIEAGGAGAIVVSCPAADCSYREGPQWIANRLKRRRTLRKGNTHFLDLAPGSREEVLGLWAMMVGDEEQAASASRLATVVGAGGKVALAAHKSTLWQRARQLAIGLVILLVLFLLSALVVQPASNPVPAEGQIRLVIKHSGQLLAESGSLPPEIAEKLPDNVDPAMVLGGERFPVRLRVAVDGEVVLEESFEPQGLRDEGASFGQTAFWLAPGSYQVEVWLMDDGAEWRSAFSGPVSIADHEVFSLLYEADDDTFQPRIE